MPKVVCVDLLCLLLWGDWKGKACLLVSFEPMLPRKVVIMYAKVMRRDLHKPETVIIAYSFVHTSSLVYVEQVLKHMNSYSRFDATETFGNSPNRHDKFVHCQIRECIDKYILKRPLMCNKRDPSADLSICISYIYVYVNWSHWSSIPDCCEYEKLTTVTRTELWRWAASRRCLTLSKWNGWEEGN